MVMTMPVSGSLRLTICRRDIGIPIRRCPSKVYRSNTSVIVARDLSVGNTFSRELEVSALRDPFN